MKAEDVIKDTPFLTISYDNSLEEIEQTMKVFYKKLNFKRNIGFSIVYLIFIAICIYMIGTNTGGQMAVLALLLCVGFMFNLWFSPFQKRARILKELSGMKQEHYVARFYETRLEVETVFVEEKELENSKGDDGDESPKALDKSDDLESSDKSQGLDDWVIGNDTDNLQGFEGLNGSKQTDNVDSADNSDGLDKLDNSLENGNGFDGLDKENTQSYSDEPVKSIYDYTLYSPVFLKTDELFLISLGGHYVHCFPKRCLSDEEIQRLDEYYEGFIGN